MGPNCSFQLLAPSQSGVAHGFSRPTNDEHLYDHFLGAMQALRGSAYLKDGAIKNWELDDEGRFPMHADEQSWHLLLFRRSEECNWVREISCSSERCDV